MTFSSSFGQRIAMVLTLVAPVGLVHCGDDDGGGDLPAATGGTGGASGGRASGGKASGGTNTGGTNTGGTNTGGTNTGGTNTGGTPTDAGAGGDSAGAGGDSAGAGGDSAGAGGDSAGAGGEPGGAGGAAGEGGQAGGAGEGGSGGEPEALHSILIGSFAPLPDYDERSIGGQALLVRTASGETRVSVQVVGLEPETEHPVHVHNQPCEFLAGTHYKIDPAVAETVEDNEVWPMFESDAEGTGSAEVTVDHLLRGDAISVVVHDPEVEGAPKMACADLVLDGAPPVTAKGSFASFADAEDADEDITGSVELVANADGTLLEYTLEGLEDDAEYQAHVHALPCDVTNAGGHYKLDPSVAETLEDNELWLSLATLDGGEVEDSVESEHRTRLDAQSVVLHRLGEDDAMLKVACAPLTVQSYPGALSEGVGVRLEGAGEKGLDDLQALGSLNRQLAGTSRVRVLASGLAPSTDYPAHVHALPCGVESGGPHYKIDPSESETVEENELWLTLSTDTGGADTAEVTFAHTARADARSIVIHDPEDGVRLACIDLAP